MKRKIIASAVVALLLVVGGVSFLGHYSNSGSPQFPSRADSSTVVLKAPNSQENLRLVTYADDKTTRTGMRIEYADGRTGIVEFDGNGKASRLTEYFPLPENMPWDTDLKQRKVLRVTDFLPDGKTVKNQSTLRANGNMQEYAVRNSDGNLIVTVYDLDVRSVLSIQTYSDKGSLMSERAFYQDGTLKSVFTASGFSPFGGYFTRSKQEFFGIDGTRQRAVYYDSYTTSVVDYAPDGKTVVLQTDYNGTRSITVTSFNLLANKTSEAVQKEYQFDTAANGGSGQVTQVEVTVVRNGSRVLEQTWLPVPADLNQAQLGSLNDGFYLSVLVDFWPDGYTHKRTINFYPGGKFVKSAEEQLTQSWEKREVRNYREDGSLDNVQTYRWSQKTAETAVPSPNNKRETIAPELLRTEKLLPAPDLKSRDNFVLPRHMVKYNFD